MASVRETAQGLAAAGVMSEKVMRELDGLCVTSARPRRRRNFANAIDEAT
jgi:hypothetical protein